MKKLYSQKKLLRPTLEIARDLLGKYLVRKIGNKKIALMITDVEAYVGLEDKASHASRGKTNRTKIMFEKGGVWYVYLIYGMYHCLNIVTEKKDYPAAILIRGVEGVSGPGRVAKHFFIDKKLNSQKNTPQSGLWIEDRGVGVPVSRIRQGKRIGVDYAGSWRHKRWRFFIAPQ